MIGISPFFLLFLENKMAGVWMQIALVLVFCSVCLASLSENDQDGVPLKAVTSSSQGSPWPMPQSITVMPVVYNLVGESQFM